MTGLLDRVTRRTRHQARELLCEGTVERVTRSEYAVTAAGATAPTVVYRRYGHWRCKTCQGGRTQKDPCSHILAALCRINGVNLEASQPAAYKTDSPRDWKTRRLANEAWPAFFKQSVGQLADLVEEADEPPRRGRPKASVRDRLLTSLVWMEDANSMQNAVGRIRQDHDFQALLDKNLSFSQVSKFLSAPETAETLDRLLLIQAAMGAPLEREAGIDGTRFSTTRRSPDAANRAGRPIRTKPPRLAIPVTMYATNLVPAVAVPTPPAEAPYVLPLLHRTMSVFDVQRVSVDAGYVIKELDLHAQVHGYDLVRPMKKGAGITESDKPEDVAYNRTVLQHAVAPGGYWNQKGKRNNTETLNSTNKQAYGAWLRCRNPVAQENEIRLRFLLHNLNRLCYLNEERGLTIDFRLAERLVDQIPWIPMENLHRMYNGPNRIHNIRNVNPELRAIASLTDSSGQPRQVLPEVIS